MKVQTTISIDHEVKQEGKKILRDHGLTLSLFVEQVLRRYIKDNDKEVRK